MCWEFDDKTNVPKMFKNHFDEQLEQYIFIGVTLKLTPASTKCQLIYRFQHCVAAYHSLLKAGHRKFDRGSLLEAPFSIIDSWIGPNSDPQRSAVNAEEKQIHSYG